jgi:hypothetical protein
MAPKGMNPLPAQKLSFKKIRVASNYFAKQPNLFPMVASSLFLTKGNPKDREANLFNLKSLNELKKDQTNIKILKNSSFDSNFNSLQSLNNNLYHKNKNIKNPKIFVAILRAIRSIRLNREE